MNELAVLMSLLSIGINVLLFYLTRVHTYKLLFQSGRTVDKIPVRFRWAIKNEPMQFFVNGMKKHGKYLRSEGEYIWVREFQTLDDLKIEATGVTTVKI